jgi:hypothetical protein
MSKQLTSLRKHQCNKVTCECGRPIDRDPVTNKPLHLVGSDVVCTRCANSSRAWKSSRCNPDNERKVDTRMVLGRALPWTAWGTVLP